MPRTNRIAAAALSLPLLLAGGAIAQESTPVNEEGSGDLALTRRQPPRTSVSFRLDGSGGYIFDADMDSGPGSVAVAHGAAGASATYTIDPTSTIALRVDAEYWHYEFDGVTGLIMGTASPFEDLHTASVGGLYRKRFDEHWSIAVGAEAHSAAESGADFSDSLTFRSALGVQYAFSESFQLGVMLVVASRLEESVRILPIPTIDWRIDDRWRFASEIQPDAAQYVLSYQLNDRWNVGVGGGFYSEQFRLDDNGPTAGGIADIQRAVVGARVLFQPGERLKIRASAGYVVYHDIELQNAAGNFLASDEVDPSPMVGLSLEFTF